MRYIKLFEGFDDVWYSIQSDVNDIFLEMKDEHKGTEDLYIYVKLLKEPVKKNRLRIDFGDEYHDTTMTYIDTKKYKEDFLRLNDYLVEIGYKFNYFCWDNRGKIECIDEGIDKLFEIEQTNHIKIYYTDLDINERYEYIDKLNIKDLDEDILDKIQDVFKKLNKEDVRDVFYDLEDFGYHIGILPCLWKGAPLARLNIRTDNDIFSILSTTNNTHKISWSEYPDLKLVNSEFLDEFTEEQLNGILNVGVAINYFKKNIQDEISKFFDDLESGYFPCLCFDMRLSAELTKDNLNPVWYQRPDMKNIISDIKWRLDKMGKELIFASRYLFIIVDKEHIKGI
jgi:hypothetical protein